MDEFIPEADDPADDPSSEPAPPEDWRAAIDDPEVRRMAVKFTSPAELAKSYDHLQRRLGRSVTLPGEDATDDEIADFHGKMGVPDDPGDYQFTVGEGREATAEDAAFQGAMAEVLHQAGIGQHQVAALNEGWNAYRDQVEGSHEAAAQQASVDAERALRREWGRDYDPNVNFARRAFAQFVGNDAPELILKDGTRLGDHPGIIKAFANIGRQMGEDDMVTGNQGGGAAASAQNRIDEIMTQHFGKPSYYDDKVQGELRRLHDKLHGAGPIVGDDARSY